MCVCVCVRAVVYKCDLYKPVDQCVCEGRIEVLACVREHACFGLFEFVSRTPGLFYSALLASVVSVCKSRKSLLTTRTLGPK